MPADHGNDAAAVANRQVRQDGVRQVRDQFADRPVGHALAARFAVNADPHLDLASPNSNVGFRRRARCRRSTPCPWNGRFRSPCGPARHAAEIVAAGGRRAADLFRHHGHAQAAAARRVCLAPPRRH